MLIKLRKVEAMHIFYYLPLAFGDEVFAEKGGKIARNSSSEKKYSDKILSTKYIKMQNSLVINKSH